MSARSAKKDAAAEEPITAINVTPLVDVCLVLVIIFMAVAPFAVIGGIQVLESRASAATGKVSQSENVSVNLDRHDKITVNGSPVSPRSLTETIQRALAKSRDRMVIVSAAYSSRVGQVVMILDSARLAGAVKLALLKNDDAAPDSREAPHGHRTSG